MPILIRGDMQIAFMKNGYKNYGIYLFEQPNSYRKVATFNCDDNADRFIEYLIKMFDIEKGEEDATRI